MGISGQRWRTPDGMCSERGSDAWWVAYIIPGRHHYSGTPPLRGYTSQVGGRAGCEFGNIWSAMADTGRDVFRERFRCMVGRLYSSSILWYTPNN